MPIHERQTQTLRRRDDRVTGAVLDANNANAPWFILGTGTQYNTVQDHVKAKIAYDF